MKLRTSLAAAGMAAALGTGAFVLPAVPSASSATHTLKFTAVQKAGVNFSKTTGANQETDVNAAGKTVGFDMIYFAAVSPTTGNVNITVDTSGGFLYGTATVSIKTGAITNGKVTGGDRQLRRGHRNDQGQGYLRNQARRHDRLQHLTKRRSTMEAGRSPQRDRPASRHFGRAAAGDHPAAARVSPPTAEGWLIRALIARNTASWARGALLRSSSSATSW